MLHCNLVKLAYMEALYTIGDRIRHARTQAELTQDQLAAKIGVTKSAVSQWENGNVENLRPTNLFALEEATAFSARWFITGKGPQKIKDKDPRQEVFNGLGELDAAAGQGALDFIKYQLEKGEGFIPPERLAHYIEMLEKIRQDMRRRKGGEE